MTGSRFVGAGAYLVLMTVWIYGVANTSESSSHLWLLPVMALAQFLLGLTLGRWWAVLLPALVVLISVPAGYPPITPDHAEPFPIWLTLVWLAVVGVPLVALGVLSRKLYERRRRRSSASSARRESRSAPGTGPPAASRR